MGALSRRCLQYACAQSLAAHLHQAERRDTTHLDARAIVRQRRLHGFLDFADVGVVLHVDEVDHDEARHVAQAQLPRDFMCGLEVGANGGRLDPVFARRPS